MDPKQKEINYYKNRLNKLSSSYMGLERQSATLNKDLIQISEGLKVISELQYMDTANVGDFSNFLDQFAEKINIRLKMDVTMILMPGDDGGGLQPTHIKAYSDYPADKVSNLIVNVPEAFLDAREHLFVSEQQELPPHAEEIRAKLLMPFFILYPIYHEDYLFGFLYVGRRDQLLSNVSVLMPYHLNTLDALSGVIMALKNQVDRNEVLELLVQKRTQELNTEKEKVEELLLNILPYETSKELTDTGSSKAREYDCVTVLFTDFKDFTKISEKLTPQALVNMLNVYYSAFDKIMTQFQMEKIKTIGDSYMCAAGVPSLNVNQAIDALRAAIEIRNFVAQEKDKRLSDGDPYFEIRIGVHSGPIVAGIVGIKKFAYDIWGDTVNVASRLEAESEPGQINISDTTYQLVKEKFTCTHRGAINVKNKGKVVMYFVDGPV
ncbi:MAG: adenylate/guanylate cyclase domain-containing protein [Granulosicoccus sp.]|nr:adenylate/guanylate cyclase domain-containing protein [Granulosicoccus sp.]